MNGLRLATVVSDALAHLHRLLVLLISPARSHAPQRFSRSAGASTRLCARRAGAGTRAALLGLRNGLLSSPSQLRAASPLLDGDAVCTAAHDPGKSPDERGRNRPRLLPLLSPSRTILSTRTSTLIERWPDPPALPLTPAHARPAACPPPGGPRCSSGSNRRRRTAGRPTPLARRGAGSCKTAMRAGRGGTSVTGSRRAANACAPRPPVPLTAALPTDRPAALQRLRNRICTYSAAGSHHTRADTHALAQNRLEIARLRAQVAILLRLARISAEELPLLLLRAAQDEPVVLPVPKAQPWIKREEGGHPLLSLCLAAEASDASSETSELAPRTGGSDVDAEGVDKERELSPGTEDTLRTPAPPMDGPSVVFDEKRRASLAPGALERIYLPLRRMSSADGDETAAGQRRRSVV